MEHESFADPQVAKLMNQTIIAIKVDREELPDVDNIYMTAATSMGESGGWPLNVFVTPDLKPFFAGTYFPKERWMDTIKKISYNWKTNRKMITDSADMLHKHLDSNLSQMFKSLGDVTMDTSLFAVAFKSSLDNWEQKYGGFGGAPKFPPSMQLQVLMYCLLALDSLKR